MYRTSRCRNQCVLKSLGGGVVSHGSISIATQLLRSAAPSASESYVSVMLLSMLLSISQMEACGCGVECRVNNNPSLPPCSWSASTWCSRCFHVFPFLARRQLWPNGVLFLSFVYYLDLHLQFAFMVCFNTTATTANRDKQSNNYNAFRP